MNKRSIQKVGSLVFATIVLVVGFLSVSCSSELTLASPISLAVVYSQRQGNAISESYFDARLDGDVDSLLYKATSPGSEMIVITTSGSPYQSQRVIAPESDAVTAEQQRSDQYFYLERYKEILKQSAANASEADPYTALKLAANWLKNQPESHKKYVLFIDNGIATTGVCSFLQEGFLLTDPTEIVEQFAKRGERMDLSGVTVLFTGLGRTSGAQKEPKESSYRHLITLWELIVRNAGGTAVIREDQYKSEIPASEFPVSIVEFPPEQPLRLNLSKKFNFDVPLYFDEEQVGFVGDSDQYVDENQAVSVIRPIAEYMMENESFSIVLVGTTAGDENSDFCYALSKSRAERVKSTLVSLGISEARITAIGSACDNPWHIKNAGLTGEFAARNRKVVLLSADSDETKELLRSFGWQQSLSR